MSCFYFYCKKKISGDPRGYVREIGALGETLEKKNFYLLSSPHPRKRKKAKVARCVRPRGQPPRPAPRPRPCPRLPPPRRPPPPVAALAPGAESQAAARVRPNSPEQRPARSRRSEPGSLGAGGGAAAPPGPRFLPFPRRAPGARSRPQAASRRRRGSGALAAGSRPGNADASGCPRRESQAIPGVGARRPQVARRDAFRRVPWIPSPLELLSRALLSQRRAHCASSRSRGRRRRAARSRPACALQPPRGARGGGG